MSSDRCRSLAHVDPTEFGISVFIFVGIFVSYLPQHIKLVQRRSSRGLSALFVLLGTVSGTAALANILTLPLSQEDMLCCRELNGFACTSALLGVLQVGVQWACFFVILLFFLIFFPRDDAEKGISGWSTWREALAVVAISTVFLLAVSIGSLVITFADRTHLQSWANFLGIVGALLAAVQYIPQIITTLRLKHVYSLSIPMMLIQTPGSFVWAASLFARLGWTGWSTWGIYLVTGMLQGMLLSIAIGFAWRERQNGKLTHAEHRDPLDDPEPIDESTPLSPDDRRYT